MTLLGANAVSTFSIIASSIGSVTPSTGAFTTISASTSAMITTSTATALAIDNSVANATVPIVDLYHSATLASTNPVYEITFSGKSDAGTKRIFGQVLANAVVATNTAEDGSIGFSVMSAGTLTQTALLTKTGLNATAIGATTASTGTFTTLIGSTAIYSIKNGENIANGATTTAGNLGILGSNKSCLVSVASDNPNSLAGCAFITRSSVTVNVFNIQNTGCTFSLDGSYNILIQNTTVATRGMYYSVIFLN